MLLSQLKFTVRFMPKAKKGPPWIIEVLAVNSAAALEKALREMRYIYAQDPVRFSAPTIDWVAP